jgi:bifunctional non-homologous end joining protein LigD
MAVKLSLPTFIAPQLPLLSAEPPTGGGWIHEIKHDGFRTLLRIDGRDARAFTRGGHDWSDKYARVTEACHNLNCQTALIDGEMIVQDRNGVANFAALRGALDGASHRLVLFAFDLLFLDGRDLRNWALEQRRAKLRWLIKPDPRSPLQFSDHYEGEGAALFMKACALGLEGIVSKRALPTAVAHPSTGLRPKICWRAS